MTKFYKKLRSYSLKRIRLYKEYYEEKAYKELLRIGL